MKNGNQWKFIMVGIVAQQVKMPGVMSCLHFQSCFLPMSERQQAMARVLGTLTVMGDMLMEFQISGLDLKPALAVASFGGALQHLSVCLSPVLYVSMLSKINKNKGLLSHEVTQKQLCR